MRLWLYFAQNLLRFTALIYGLFILIFWLSGFSSLIPLAVNPDGEPLGLLLKMSMALGRALPNVLELNLVILMLATVIALTLMGRRAELHIVRGAGQSGLKILLGCALVGALLTSLLILMVTPLTAGYEAWANKWLRPQIARDLSTQQENRVAWFTAEDGAVQGRLSGFNPDQNTATQGLIVIARAETLPKTFLQVTDIRVNSTELSGTFTDLEGLSSLDVLQLDAPIRLLPLNTKRRDKSIFHLMGWIGNVADISLTPRQISFFLQIQLAQPLLAAALILISGTLCVGIGTRQSIGILAFGTLTIVVLAYSLAVVTEAFGVNGKLHPAVAAWGPPIMLFALGLAILNWQELSWILGKTRPKRLS